MQGSIFQEEGGMINAGQYCPGKGRHGQYRAVPSSEREARQMQGNIFQGKGRMVSAGHYFPREREGSTFQGKGGMVNAG